ncbi:ABC transporter permease [Rossellomorea marisflavi]|uniref:ABC transporter permease n=1 Tax=Rossellomorea marisflavi TaxID=189381 RepID=UPI003457F0D5
MKQLFINPMLNKEFKLRFRSFKSFIGIFCYLMAISIVVIGFIYFQSRMSMNGYFRPNESRTMFMILSFLQISLVLFITPGLTGGLISGEREKQTLSMLLTTEQSSTSIILSKLVSSVSYLLLLILSSLPIYSFVFLFGGVAPTDVLMIFGYSLFLVFVFGSFGIFFSTIIRKTIVSMVTAYGSVLFLVGGSLFLFALTMALTGVSSNGTPATNPIAYFMAMFNPGIVLYSHFEPSMMDEILSMTGISFPLWISFIITYSILAILSLFGSIRKLRPRMKTRARG